MSLSGGIFARLRANFTLSRNRSMSTFKSIQVSRAYTQERLTNILFEIVRIHDGVVQRILGGTVLARLLAGGNVKRTESLGAGRLVLPLPVVSRTRRRAIVLT